MLNFYNQKEIENFFNFDKIFDFADNNEKSSGSFFKPVLITAKASAYFCLSEKIIDLKRIKSTSVGSIFNPLSIDFNASSWYHPQLPEVCLYP